MLNDSSFFQAVLQTLPQVKEMNQAQIELGMANESIASEFKLFLDCFYPHRLIW